MMNFLITGKPGIGKTTLIREIFAQTSLNWGGFYTTEILEFGNRVGFKIFDLNGRSGLLAHVQLDSKFKVGKYSVNIADIDSIAVFSIEQALLMGQPVLIDEIGKMELFSEKFRQIIEIVLAAPPVVLGTLTLANIPFVNRIRKRTDLIVANLTSDNRKIMKTMILDFLRDQELLHVRSK